MIRHIAFWSALAAYIWLAVLIVAGGAAYPGYSHLGQYISELGAHGAPRGALVSWAGFAPIGVLLMIFFAIAAFLQPRGLLRGAGFACLFLFGLSYLGAAFYPCAFECRPEAPSPSQTIHTLFGLAGYIGAPIGLVLLAFASRKWPSVRALFPLGLICALIAGGALFTMTPDAPYVGLTQRVLEGAVAVWTIACAFALRKPREGAPA